MVDGYESRHLTQGSATQEPIPGVEAVKRVLSSGTKPDAWVIALGTNDVNSFDSTDSAKKAVMAVLSEVGDANVLWMNLYVVGSMTNATMFNTALGELTTEHQNLRVMDWSSVVADNPIWLNSDGVHYTPGGYKEASKLLA